MLYLWWLVVSVVGGSGLLRLEHRLELAHDLVIELQLLSHAGEIDGLRNVRQMELLSETGGYRQCSVAMANIKCVYMQNGVKCKTTPYQTA